MANAFCEGERVGVIVLADSGPARVKQAAATSTRMQRIADCQSALQHLLGEVPPLLMLSYPLDDLAIQGQPNLAQDSMLGGFLQSVGAETLLVTDPGRSDPAYEAALGLASRIITVGLAQRLVVMPLHRQHNRAAASRRGKMRALLSKLLPPSSTSRINQA